MSKQLVMKGKSYVSNQSQWRVNADNLLPLNEAIEACEAEKARGCAVFTEIVKL